ncbi:hypothetical protein Barb7_01364 [Bacteroidales bacterium Barb7]|nr:hypothetical protein Barb7_01364 [Bacteroidales bacterium Barb7]
MQIAGIDVVYSAAITTCQTVGGCVVFYDRSRIYICTGGVQVTRNAASISGQRRGEGVIHCCVAADCTAFYDKSRYGVSAVVYSAAVTAAGLADGTKVRGCIVFYSCVFVDSEGSVQAANPAAKSVPCSL